MIRDYVVKAVSGVLKEDVSDILEVPKSFDMGDYALPCFSFSKKLRKNPVEIANDIAKKIKAGKEIEKVVAVGGYVNFFLNSGKLAERVIGDIKGKKEKYGSGKSGKGVTMVEFSQPNTHKAFHFGHVRGTSLGESLARILEFSGEKAVRANYSGDTGMHIAKWLWCYMKYHSHERIVNDEKWIAGIYVDAVKKLESNESFAEEVEEINRKLDSRNDEKLNKLWDMTRKFSISSWDRIYHELNTRFDVHYFESEFEKSGKKECKNLINKKIAKLSDGATIVDLKNKGLGVIVLLRKDGTVLYGAKDLALARKKFRDYNLNRSIYVIGKAQDLHIHQVFEILKMAGFKYVDSLEYVPISEIRFPWGKMSSRSGENVLYSEFRDKMIEYAVKEIEKRYKLSSKDAYDRALAIATAAIKYSILKQDVNKNIIFNPKEEIKFEGDTGPYLLYSYARALSILEKAKYKGKRFSAGKLGPEEKKLAVLFGRFPEIVENSYRNLNPALIAHYSYELAKTFSEFYHNCQVIGSDSEQFRLELVSCFAQVLKNSLNLLGIDVLEKM